MVDKFARDFIKEIRNNIKEKDFLKAAYVLDHLDAVDRKTQREALLALSRGDEDFVVPLIIEVLAKRPELDENCYGLKGTLISKALCWTEHFLILLEKEFETEKKILLAEIAGEMNIPEATPILARLLSREENLRLVKSIIKALGMIGSPGSINILAEYLYSWNAEIIIESAYALGQIQSAESFQRLFERLGLDHDLDVIILDIFAKNQTPDALDRLNVALSSRHAQVSSEAKKRLIKIGSKAVPFLLNNLSKDDPDLLIQTLNALGEIGDESAISFISKLLHSGPSDSNVRFSAYEALGELHFEKGAIALAIGLEDPEPNVRSAAAKAIDHNYNSLLSSGIKNMIRDGGPEAENIVRAIVDSQCGEVFIDLISEESFRSHAVEYLKEHAHPDTQSYFRSLLKKNKLKGYASMISKSKTKIENGALKVFAIDDSKMILSLYRTVLHNLGCKPQLFEFPSEALKKLDEEKPDVILTDLNMPDINGIELAKGVRKLYGKEEIPVIMVTTQSESSDIQAAFKAGVNAILHKPFNEHQMGEAISQFVKLPVDFSSLTGLKS
ncbi:HEAT repeat domain-containing protein [Thermodesulfobacteriota bacterium]